MQGEVLLIPGIVLLGLICTYTDLKFGKIYNRFLVLGAIYAVSAYSFLYFFESLSFNPIHILINSTIALVAAIFFWNYGLWSSGDAKLFFVYSLLVPQTIFIGPVVSQFYSLDILINTFVPMIPLFMLQLLRRIKSSYQKVAKEVFDIEYVKSVLFLFCIIWIVSLIIRYSGIDSNPLLRYGITILVFMLIRKLPGKLIILIIGAISLLRVAFDTQIFTGQFLPELSVIMILSFFFKRYIFEIMTEIFSYPTHISYLKSGMLLSDRLVIEKDKIVTYDANKHKGFELIPFLPAEGLTEEEIRTLQESYNEGKMHMEYLGVKQTIPFAPSIFIGVLITILVNGNIFKLIIDILA